MSLIDIESMPLPVSDIGLDNWMVASGISKVNFLDEDGAPSSQKAIILALIPNDEEALRRLLYTLNDQNGLPEIVKNYVVRTFGNALMQAVIALLDESPATQKHSDTAFHHTVSDVDGLPLPE